MNKRRDRYVICVRSEDADDLEIRKVYRVLPDESASTHGHLRIVDESGEDYLYPNEWFIAVDIPEHAEKAFAATSTSPRGR